MNDDGRPPRTLAERAKEAWTAAQERVSALRLARARGGDGAPSASDVAKAKDAAELAEDRARLAEEAAAEAEQASAEEARRAAIRAERLRVQTIHADTAAAAREVHEAAERLCAAIAGFAGHVNHLAATEPFLNSHFSAGAIGSAVTLVAAGWPQNLPLPTARPIPYRDAARRARWPDEQLAFIRERLPVPPDPDNLSAQEHAA